MGARNPGVPLTSLRVYTWVADYISVGQAASTLIVGPEGDTMLIDTGDFRTDGEQVLEYLETQNIDRIACTLVEHVCRASDIYF